MSSNVPTEKQLKPQRNKIDDLSEQISKVRRRRERLKVELESAVENLESSRNRERAWRKTQKLVQGIAKAIQNKIHKRLCDIATNCLQIMFGKSYRFTIDFEEKRGRTEARMRIWKKNLELDPLQASGGGLAEVVSLALRIAVLELKRQKKSTQLVVLDEPFCFVDVAKIPKLLKVIEQLATQLKYQFIIVSHIPEIKTMGSAQIVNLEQMKGIS